MQASRDQTSEMRHINHEIGTDRIGDLAEFREIPMARIGRTPCDDQLGSMLLGELGDIIHVDAIRVLVDTVGDRLEPFARYVDRRTMGKMATSGQIKTHERIARLQQREEDSLVGLAAGIWLDVGEPDAKQLRGALNGETLGDIDILASAVIAAARIALGIFIREDRALRFEHSARNDVLGCDQLDLITLAAEFLVDRFRHVGIDGVQVGIEEGRRLVEAGIGLGHGFPLDAREHR